MENEQADAGTGPPNPVRETKFSGANRDREILFFPVQLTTSRIDNLTRLIHTQAIFDDHTNTCAIYNTHTHTHDRAGLRGYVQMKKHTHTYVRTRLLVYVL